MYIYIFFSTGFCNPYRTLAFLNGLLDPQTFGRTPWLGDQSNARPLPTHRTTQHRNTQTHIHVPSRFRTCDLRNLVRAIYPAHFILPDLLTLMLRVRSLTIYNQPTSLKPISLIKPNVIFQITPLLTQHYCSYKEP
jgi:hypothetical protein